VLVGMDLTAGHAHPFPPHQHWSNSLREGLSTGVSWDGPHCRLDILARFRGKVCGRGRKQGGGASRVGAWGAPPAHSRLLCALV
jgi:hypothetical protein